MMVQVTAAALVAENRVLANPASPGSITTSGNKEDFVSMGMTAALKLQQVVRNTRCGAGDRGAGRGAGAGFSGTAEIRRIGRASAFTALARNVPGVGRRSGVFGSDSSGRRVDRRGRIRIRMKKASREKMEAALALEERAPYLSRLKRPSRATGMVAFVVLQAPFSRCAPDRVL